MNGKLRDKIKDNKTYTWIIVVVAFFLMFFHFYVNAFHVISNDSFKWQTDSEAWVLNKIENARSEGIFANSGLLGGSTVYRAQIGLQGMVFSLIDQATFVFNLNIKHLLYALTAGMLAVVLLFILYWFKQEFGFGCSTIVYLCTMGSYWVLRSARNLYWVTWTMLLPFLTVLLILMIEERTGKQHQKLTFLLVLITMSIRLACGFEFVSSIMIAMELPFVYYAIKNRWKIKTYIFRSFQTGVAAIFSFLLTFVINLSQRAIYLGTLEAALKDVEVNIGKRTGFFAVNFSSLEYGEVYRNSLDVSLQKVIYTYLKNSEIVTSFNALEIILIVMVCGVLCYIAKDYSKTVDKNRRKLFSLLTMTGVACLAPLSWFVLAKGHSYIHTHINYLLWNMPFTILGTGLCGAVIIYLLKDLFQWINLGIKKYMKEDTDVVR